jgi:hypothetical protein
MNEKINELMLEATENMPKTYYWPGQYVEKFAELIVRECARIARIYSEEGVEFNGGDAIKEHFGVEE